MNNDDPRGLIADAYRMEGISMPECRSIFLDWALEPRDAGEIRAASARLFETYVKEFPQHPMTSILQESIAELAGPPQRRGGRRRLSR